MLGLVQDLFWETLEANGTQINCSWVHLDLGSDVAQPLLTLPGTTCGPGLVSSLGGQGEVERQQCPGPIVHCIEDASSAGSYALAAGREVSSSPRALGARPS